MLYIHSNIDTYKYTFIQLLTNIHTYIYDYQYRDQSIIPIYLRDEMISIIFNIYTIKCGMYVSHHSRR